MSEFDDIVSSLDQTVPNPNPTFTADDIPEATRKATSRSPGRGRPRKSSQEPKGEPRPTTEEEPAAPKKSSKVITDALLRKIRAYRNSRQFQGRLEHIQVRDDMTLLEAQQAYKECLQVLSHDFNRKFVKELFCKGLQGTEMVMVHYLNIHNVSGIADELLTDEEMMTSFEDELEELAIELDNYYQPGPLTRLVGKVAISVTEVLKRRVEGLEEEEVEVDLEKK